MPIEIDLRGGNRESISFEPKDFSFPPETTITIIDPPSIELEWEDVVTRQIPVQAAITGQPADGYIVKGEPDVDPTQLTVRGPVSVIEVMQFARLAAFDVSGLSEGTHRRRIAIDAPPVRARYIGPSAANVTVTMARRVSEAKFENRPMEVVGVPGAGAVPHAVDVTVTGPPEIVHALRPEQIVPRADLSQAPNVDLKKHGSAVVKVTVELGHADSRAAAAERYRKVVNERHFSRFLGDRRFHNAPRNRRATSHTGPRDHLGSAPGSLLRPKSTFGSEPYLSKTEGILLCPGQPSQTRNQVRLRTHFSKTEGTSSTTRPQELRGATEAVRRRQPKRIGLKTFAAPPALALT